MKIIGVIPARYQSSRFPGKPLADICGKPMIWWVYQEAKSVAEFADVIVATESEKVADVCRELGIHVRLTSDSHPTGTDRVAEVAQSIDADWYVIIMGDEPLLCAEDEKRLIDALTAAPDADAAMLTERFVYPLDLINPTTIKLAINDQGYLIFMSRAAIPFPKEALDYNMYKNVGCYAMRKSALDFFLRTKPGCIEQAEGIELLRLLEHHKKVLTVPIESESMSVDTPKDLERIRAAIRKKLEIGGGYNLSVTASFSGCRSLSQAKEAA